jgi:Secretion system C-terminal sorting domain
MNTLGKSILALVFLLAFAVSGLNAQNYKIGVLVHGRNMSEPDISKILDDMVREVASNEPVREKSGKKVELVVQLEIPWAETEKKRGTYKFDWFKTFARLCEERKIKWTALLSPHYVPDFYLKDYDRHRIRDANKNLVESTFIPISPSSGIWGAEAKNWIAAFVNELSNVNGKNYFGTITEVLVGNEMMFPNNVLTSYDDATANKFKAKYGKTLPSTLTAEFMNFRADELSYSIVSMINATSDALGKKGIYNVGIASKLYPYYFQNTSNWSSVWTDSKTKITYDNRRKGYTNTSVSYIKSSSKGLFAVDLYPKTKQSKEPWKISDDYNTVGASTLPLYVAEYNRPHDCNDCGNLTEQDVYDAVMLGINSYNVRYFTFYAWNDDRNGLPYNINSEQKKGLKRAFDAIVPLPTYIKIQNRWTGQYLFDGGSRLEFGSNSNSGYYLWIVEDYNGYKRLRNKATGDYIHIENLRGYVQASSAELGWWSSHWTFENAGSGYTRFLSRWQGKSYIHCENRNYYAEWGSIKSGWYSAQFKMIPVSGSGGREEFVKPAEDLVLFPNPSGGKITFNMPTSFTLLSLQGNELGKFENVTEADVSHLNNGIYIIHTSEGQNKRLIIQK